MSPQPGEVLVGVEGGQTGHMAAPLSTQLDTESLQGPHSAPDKDGATCKYFQPTLILILLLISTLEFIELLSIIRTDF